VFESLLHIFTYGTCLMYLPRQSSDATSHIQLLWFHYLRAFRNLDMRAYSVRLFYNITNNRIIRIIIVECYPKNLCLNLVYNKFDMAVDDFRIINNNYIIIMFDTIALIYLSLQKKIRLSMGASESEED
ncbi:hypothetical protein ACJX0J_025170, partial [Zea mays]